MKLQVLGTGCAKCEQLRRMTEQTAEELGIEYELEKVSDILEIAGMGVMVTPALVVDGELKCSGSLPTMDQLRLFLS